MILSDIKKILDVYKMTPFKQWEYFWRTLALAQTTDKIFLVAFQHSVFQSHLQQSSL